MADTPPPTWNRGEYLRVVGIHSAGMIVQATSDWSLVIISTLPPSLTWSRGECLRVVGIYSDG